MNSRGLTPLSFVWVGGSTWGGLVCSLWTRCVCRQLSHSDKVIFLSLFTSQYRGIFFPQRRSFLKWVELKTANYLNNLIMSKVNYLVAVTSSLNVFHSLRSQTLFLFLSNRTKLRVAIFSSSVPHFVLSTLNSYKNHKKFKNQFENFQIFLPNVCAGSGLRLKKFFQIFEKFTFLWTTLHRPNRDIRICVYGRINGDQQWLKKIHFNNFSRRMRIAALVTHRIVVACLWCYFLE